MSITSKFARDILAAKYAQEKPDGSRETWDDVAHRVASNIVAPVFPEYTEEVERLIRERKFMPGGRYLYASGRPYQAVNNCFTLIAEDSREGWAKLLHDATHALMSGGGIGVYYGNIREEGAKVTGLGGACSGPIGLMEAVNEIARQIMAGGSRRSAVYASLPWWHEDVEKFIRLKDWDEDTVARKAKDFNSRAPMDMTNISVALDDAFFDLMDGDATVVEYRLGHNTHLRRREDAQHVYRLLVEHMLTTGEPGIQIDVADNAGEVGRNAPLTGDTNVLTSDGYHQISDVVDTPVTVWTGEQWAPDVVFKETNPSAETVRVAISGRRTIGAEPSHEFVVVRDGVRVNVPAADLVPGDRLVSDLPPLEAVATAFDASEYTLGWLYGDGSFRNGGAELTLCAPEKMECFDYLTGYDNVNMSDGRGFIRAYFHKDDRYTGRTKERVPASDITPSFLGGLFDSDGNVHAESHTVRLASIHESFLHDIRRGLEALGIRANVHRAGTSTFGKKEGYMLVVAKAYVDDFLKMVPLHRLALRPRGVVHRRSDIRVMAVEPGETQPVYCADVRVPEHTFMAEGVLVRNCTELTTRDHLDVCNLGSLNLAYIEDIDEMKSATEAATAFLLAGTIVGEVPMAEVRRVRERTRRLGLGLMGIYEWLIARGYTYDPNEELGQWLAIYRDVSRTTADRLADEAGVSRPVKVRAIAPTGTIGILAETTSGIEPLFATAYKRRYLKGKTWHYQAVVDEGARRLVERYDVDPTKIETAYDLAYTPERRIAFQAYVQEFVDHGISSTLNLPSVTEHAISPEKFGAMLYRYLPRLRGITAYPNEARGGQPLTVMDYHEAMLSEGMEFEEFGSENACVGGVCGV